MTIIVIAVVSGALLAGAIWGIYGTLPDKLEGFIVALAGGALLISAALELIDPATEQVSICRRLRSCSPGRWSLPGWTI